MKHFVHTLCTPAVFGIIRAQVEIDITSFESWCREGESNPQGTKYRRILSPLRLPVPPSRLSLTEEEASLIYNLSLCNRARLRLQRY